MVAKTTKADEPEAVTTAPLRSRPLRPGTRPGHLLLVAARRFGAVSFNFADLIVALWQADPMLWGLAGFEDKYPNSKLVACTLSSKTTQGPFDRFVERVDVCRYRLTPAGLTAANKMTPPQKGPTR